MFQWWLVAEKIRNKYTENYSAMIDNLEKYKEFQENRAKKAAIVNATARQEEF